MGSCDVCGREVKDYGVFLGGIRCPNHCMTFGQAMSDFTESEKHPKIQCPKCGNDDLDWIEYLEDLVLRRGLRDHEGLVLIESTAKDQDYWECNNARLICKKVTYNPDGTVNICDHEFDMPENLEYDWE